MDSLHCTHKWLSRPLLIALVIGFAYQQANALPNITLTSTQSAQTSPNEQETHQRTSRTHQTPSQQKPGFLETTLNTFKFLDPNYLSNKLFIGPITNKLAQIDPSNGQLVNMLLNLGGGQIIQWLWNHVLGYGLNYITGAQQDGFEANRAAGLLFATPLESLTLSNTNDNGSNLLHLTQAGGINEKLGNLFGKKKLATGIKVASAAHNSYALLRAAVILKNLLSNSKKYLEDGVAGGQNPFISLLSNIGDAGGALHNLTRDPLKNSTKPSGPMTVLRDTISKNPHLLRALALGTHAGLSATQGHGKQWAAGNAANVGQTALGLIGVNERLNNFANKIAPYAIGGLIAALAGLFAWDYATLQKAKV